MVSKELVASDPAEVGLDPQRADELLERAGKEVAQGLLPAVQIAVGREGRIGAFHCYGDCTEDSLFCIFSSTKVFVASAIWILLQEGKIREGTKVVEIVPEFATNGKDKVTLEHVMLHTAGFPLAPYAQDEWNSVEARRKRFSQWRLDWEPGTQFQYHATSAHWLLADIIERVTGKDFRAYIRERVLDPLGLDNFYLGLPPEQDARVKDVVHKGERVTPEQLREMGFPVIPEGEVTEDAIIGLNTPETRRAGVPGGGGITDAATLAIFYQYLLGDLNGAGRIFEQGVLEDVMRVRTGDLADPFTRVPCNRGLGVVLAGGDGRANWRGFGHTTSPRAFGHGGAGGQIGWADPETGISLGYVTNGFDRDVIRQGRRGVGISSRAGALVEPASAGALS